MELFCSFVNRRFLKYEGSDHKIRDRMHEIQHNTVDNLRDLTHEHRSPLALEYCSTALMYAYRAIMCNVSSILE